MKKIIFTLFIVTLSVVLFSNQSTAISERKSAAKKFKEVKRLINKMKKDYKLPFHEIMPKIKEATKYFKKEKYQQTREILDGLIAKLKSIKNKPLVESKDEKLDYTKINTSGWQDTPFITSDGKKLFFTYSPHDFLRAKKNKFRKIEITGPIRSGHTRDEYITTPQVLVVHNYVSKRKGDNSWSTPQPIHFDGGDRVGGSMGITEDGNTMYLAGGWSKPSKTTFGKGDIYVSTRKSNNNWTKPQNLGATINTKYLEDNPHITSDGTVLYFDSDRPGGKGKWDIYYSVKNDNGSWSKPSNLGPPINTEAVEGMPFITQDGKRIYFIRGDPVKRKPAEIYFSTKLSNGSWSNPELIDLGIKNIDSPSLTEDEKELYFLWADHQSEEIAIWSSRKNASGTWELPKPID